MCDKSFINSLTIGYYHLKKLGWAYFVPHIVLFLVIPILSVGNVLNNGRGDHALLLIFYDFQRYLPFFSCWWIILGLSDCVEGPVSPVIRLYRKSFLGDFFLLFFWYMFHVALLFTGYAIFLENYWPEFSVIFFQSFIFTSLGFSLLIISKTTMVPFVLLFAYEMFAMLSDAGIYLSLSLFFSLRVEDILHPLTQYGAVVVASLAIMLVSSAVFRKKGHTSYNAN